MLKEYKNLDDLLLHSPNARNYFDSLTDIRQQGVRQHQNSIHYDKDLRTYAENLLLGGY